jgi:hypothetical protein
VLDHRRRIRLANHRGAVDRVARAQGLARVDGGITPCPIRVEPIGAKCRERAGTRGEDGPLVLHVLRLADCFDGDRLDDERLSGHQEAVLLPVAALEFGDHECGVVLRGDRSVVSVPSYFKCSTRSQLMRDAAIP